MEKTWVELLHGMAEDLERLQEKVEALAAMAEGDGLEEALERMRERGDVASERDVMLAGWVIDALETQLGTGRKWDNPKRYWSRVDTSIKTLTEMVGERHEVVDLSARRVGYVVKEVIGLETKRRSQFNGRHCVLYDEGVIRAWRERYERG